MEFTDYFEERAEDDIRIKGTNWGIESILYEHLHNSSTPHDIVAIFPGFTLEQVFATLLFYERDKARLDAYLTGWLSACEQEHADAQKQISVTQQLLNLRAQRTKAKTTKKGQRPKRDNKELEPEYTVRHANEPSNQRFEAFFAAALELYDVLRERQRESALPAELPPDPPIDERDPKAVVAEVNRRVDAVLCAPELNGGEKNRLLRLIVDKIIPYEDALEIHWL